MDERAVYTHKRKHPIPFESSMLALHAATDLFKLYARAGSSMASSASTLSKGCTGSMTPHSDSVTFPPRIRVPIRNRKGHEDLSLEWLIVEDMTQQLSDSPDAI